MAILFNTRALTVICLNLVIILCIKGEKNEYGSKEKMV